MDTPWRRKLVAWSEARPGARILDGACGTGALAFEFIKKLGLKTSVTALDFCPEMLQQAQKNWELLLRKEKKLTPPLIQFQLADMEKLPFPDQSFHITACAYGLRNTQDPQKILKELARVTKSQGLVMILETGKTPYLFLSPLFYLYFRWIMPQIGGLATGKKSAYEHLQTSSRSFPSGEKFLNLLKNTKCFSRTEYKTLFLGASFIYKARVI